MGPHPAVAQVRAAVRSAVFERDGMLLVACSGGADSLALAAATAFVAARAGRPAALVTIDHGMQADSAVQAARTATLGYELGFDPVHSIRVAVGVVGGPEAAARTARYAALEATAQALDGAWVLLGHTLDDQAETVLLGLGRGSGPRSIAGMRPAEGCYLRPLLGVRRATTEQACQSLGLQPWRDPHNEDAAYQRVRIRHEVLPLLEDVLHGGVVEALARTATLVRADLDALDALGCDPASIAGPALPAPSLAGLPAALRSRTLRAWAGRHGATALSAAHTAALDALVTDWHGQGPIDLPGGHRVVRRSDRLEFEAPATRDRE